MEKNLLLLIFFTIFVNAQTEFILSYKLRTQNAYAVNEQVFISKAMIISDEPVKKICTLPKKIDKNRTTLSYLQKYKYKLLECFKQKTVFVNSNSINRLDRSYSQITIKTLPVRFTVKFNNGFGIISSFK